MPVKYPVILEKTNNNWAAYSPDVLGCMALGKTAEQALEEYIKALSLHLQGMKEDNLPLPQPSSRVEYVSIPV